MANLKFEDISFAYGSHVVLDHYSLEVNDKEILGIVGPSGCGKTTLLRALCGFINPSTGNIYIGDRLVYSASQKVNVPPEKRNVGVVFQDYAIWPHLSVWDNVCYPMKKRKLPKAEMEEKANYALEQVRMTGYKKHMPGQLSGGQQQRVAIARALVSSDELIVLDEPITNLDAKLREEMLVEIKLIQQRLGTTVVYITHDQEASLRLCDRIVVMDPKGHIRQIGTDEDIVLNPNDRYIFTFIGISNFLPVSKKDGKVVLGLGGNPVVSDSVPENFPEGDVEMGVRPMDIVFDETSPIKGTITSATFLGNQYDFFVDLAGKELRVEINALDLLDKEYKEGETVGLRFHGVKYYNKGGEL